MLAAFEFESRRTYGAAMKKKPLPAVQARECAALKAIYLEKRRTLELTQEKAAEALGMNQGSFSHYLNGRNALNVDFASRVAKLLGVSVREFSPRLANLIDEMAGHVRNRKITDALEMALFKVENIVPTTQPWREARKYPLASWIAAGTPADSPEGSVQLEAEDYFESTENAGEHGYWLDVRGPSMTGTSSPSFPEGTRILVRPEGFDLVSGKFYVARHREGEKTFKQYLYDAGAEYLVPLNPSFRPIEMDENWEIIGRVIDARIPGL